MTNDERSWQPTRRLTARGDLVGAGGVIPAYDGRGHTSAIGGQTYVWDDLDRSTALPLMTIGWGRKRSKTARLGGDQACSDARPMGLDRVQQQRVRNVLWRQPMLKTRIYSRLGRQLLVAFVLVVMGLVATITIGGDVVAGRLTGQDRWIGILFLTIFIPCFWIAVRMPFLKIVARPDEVKVVSYLRSRTVAWTRVERVEPPPVYGLFGAGVRFVLTDGSVVADDAFARAPVESSEATERAVRELEEYRRAAWVRARLLDADSSP